MVLLVVLLVLMRSEALELLTSAAVAALLLPVLLSLLFLLLPLLSLLLLVTVVVVPSLLPDVVVLLVLQVVLALPALLMPFALFDAVIARCCFVGARQIASLVCRSVAVKRACMHAARAHTTTLLQVLGRVGKPTRGIHRGHSA
jgi:hypothetical protein